MTQRETGTVKWFNHTRGYGFIENSDGAEVFIHHKDIEMDGYRYVRRGQIVSFVCVDEGDGPKAKELRIESEPSSSKEPGQNALPDEEPGGPGYRYNEIIKLEEDREHEFKSLQNTRDPVKTIIEYYVEKYVNAFLNTNGGAILFGIDDAGRVQGIELDRGQRDRLRTSISRLINKFQPAVEPDLYDINFMPVQDRNSTFVVEIKVAKGTANLYMTGSQNFYLRRDGSNFLMPFDMIRARLQAPPQTRHPKANDRDADLQPEIQQLASTDLDLGILLAMVFMSWSDSKLSEREIRLIEKRAHDQELDEHEVNILLQATVHPPLLETIVSYLPSPESRKAAATIAYLTALSDSILTEAELAAFDKMCAALDLTQSDRTEIRKLGERQMRSE